jgi:uncharacterized protein YjbI with pentapeptide repeats
MSNEEHLTMLERGLGSWNKWREQYPAIRPDLTSANLRDANLRLLNLAETDFAGTNLSGADLTGANLTRACLTQANLNAAILDLADLAGADLRHVDFRGSSGGRLFSRANLRGANLENVKLSSAKLDGTDLREANLSGAILGGADLRDANLAGADLRSAYLSQATLSGADLSDANLSAAIAPDASFERVRLFKTKLKEANLSGALFMWADLVQVDLSKADLSRANLSYVRLAECDLSEARLVDCLVAGIRVTRLSLDGAKQSNLVLAFGNTYPISVDELEVAQFVSTLLESESIRKLIDLPFAGMVLILGCFAGEKRALLDAMRRELKSNGYSTVVIDFSNATLRQDTKTLLSLAGLVRFIIAEITESRGVLQALVSIVENPPPVPIQLVHERGTSPRRLNESMKRYPWVFKPRPYKDSGELVTLLREEMIQVSEAKANELLKTRESH